MVTTFMVARTLIVRIYRRMRHRPDRLLGIVEEVGTEEERPFGSLAELWEIINHPAGKRRRKATRGGTHSPSSHTK